VRDAATLFDENAAILLCRDPKWFKALQQRQWTNTLWVQRDSFLQETRLIMFGHALLEKLQNPYKAITTHVFCLVVQEDLSHYFDWQRGWTSVSAMHCFDSLLSHKISELFESNEFLPRSFIPLPVLGIPNWTIATAWKQNLMFYQDQQVFRLGKFFK
jgi:hypothetical protein